MFFYVRKKRVCLNMADLQISYLTTVKKTLEIIKEMASGVFCFDTVSQDVKVDTDLCFQFGNVRKIE